MLQRSKGAISIFLIIITLSSVIFAGLFIDASRILVADRKVQNALNSAARSALSYYDQDLVAEYGLYGVSQAEAQSQFSRYFEDNLVLARNDNLNLFKFDVNNAKSNTYAKINVQQPLVAEDPAVFKNQILEYMKYKAPVTVTEGVISKFTRAFSNKRGTTVGASSGIGESFNKFRDKVNKLKTGVIDNLRKNLGQALTDKAKDIILDANKTSIEDYFSLMSETASKLDQADAAVKSAQEQINSYEADYNEMKKQAGDTLAGENSTVEKDYDQNSSLTTAKQQIQTITENLQNGITQLSSIKSQLDTVLPHYYELKNKIIKLRAELAAAIAAAAATAALGGKPDMSRINSLRNQIKQIEDEMTRLENTKINPLLEQLSSINIDSLTEVNVDLSDKEGNNAKKEAEQKKLDQNTSELKAKLDKERIFKTISSYKISSAVRSANSQDNADQDFTNEANVKKGSDNVFTYFMKIAAVLAKGVRDDIYVTEYIMDKCTFLTSQTERNHYFKRGEVEYILCGNDYEWQNIVETVAIISAIRMAINTVDFFIRNPIPEPLSRLAYALTRGALQTVMDMAQMIFTVGGSSTEIPICPSLKGKAPGVTYSDHLRLALLLKMDGSLNGLQDTMQATLKTLSPTAKDLTKLNTQVKATARVKVNLIFLPMLGIEKMNFANFEDGQFVINKEITLGY